MLAYMLIDDAIDADAHDIIHDMFYYAIFAFIRRRYDIVADVVDTLADVCCHEASLFYAWI